MIITKISGGLGNQMFQYATGESVSLLVDAVHKLDISSYSDDRFGRHYSLGVFKIKASLASPKEIKRLRPPKNFFSEKSPRLFRLFSSFTKTYVNEEYCKGVIPKNTDKLFLDGYWQNEKYFIDHSRFIRQEFQFKLRPDDKTASYLRRIKSTNSVSIHVRRGDYVSIARIGQAVGICGEKYYQRAIKLITKQVKNPTFFIFSEQDGLDWAKENLNIKHQFVLVEGGKDYEDLRLMSSCKHNIIANSAFSWWGGWLNANPNKVVVAPDPWFSQATDQSKQIVPSSWFKVAKE